MAFLLVLASCELPEVPNFDGDVETLIEYRGVGNDGVTDVVNGFGEGAFRTSCRGGQLLYDDPIAAPGQPGDAHHLHQFFGNLEANANSTPESLLASGDSTCQGGPLNRTAYWIPALIDSADDTVIPIDVSVVYYKVDPNFAGVVEQLPAGLEMVADDPAHIRWNCDGEVREDAIGPGCDEFLIGIIDFPACWNGVDLASADGSHMVYRDHGQPCPQSHPHLIPTITENIRFSLPSTPSEGWYLSSDPDPATNGATLHGDWMGAWNPNVSLRWWFWCLRDLQDASFGQLCDGWVLNWPAQSMLQPAEPVPPRP